MTPESFDALSEELRYLWKVKRPEVTARVAEAAAQGDRSENAEYIYGKKQLREIDRRVRYLNRRLDTAEVVRRKPPDTSRVFFGAWVTLEDEAGAEQTLRLVGTDEAGTAPGFVSIDSPMARALLGRRVDDDISVDGPAGERGYAVLAIHYQEPGRQEPGRPNLTGRKPNCD